MKDFNDIGMSAQQQHDEATRGGIKLAPNSRQTLEALLEKKRAASSKPLPSVSLDPIAHRVSQVAGLTMEEAEAELKALGFI